MDYASSPINENTLLVDPENINTTFIPCKLVQLFKTKVQYGYRAANYYQFIYKIYEQLPGETPLQRTNLRIIF